MKILIQDEHGVRELEKGYASEEELQVFLREHPELIPVDDIELGTPPLLCIGWEVSVASGSEDLLYLDETGLLTIIETKLGRNRDARRAVVGQILEYASYACAWTTDQVEVRAQKFLSSDECPKQYRGLALEQALRHFLESTNPAAQDGFSYEDFLSRVRTNLELGHIRLVIVIDDPPDPLLRTVEFVNRFSERFEMYLIQLKRFHDKATDANIFVPALFGRVARAETKRRPGRQWDNESFLQQASEKCPESLSVLKRLIEFAQGEKAITWGRGASVSSFQFLFSAQGGRKLPAFFVMANGRMSFDFWTLSKWLPTDVVAAYRENLRSAKDIPAEAVNTDTWKEFAVIALNSPQSWDAFCRAVLALKAATESKS